MWPGGNELLLSVEVLDLHSLIPRTQKSDGVRLADVSNRVKSCQHVSKNVKDRERNIPNIPRIKMRSGFPRLELPAHPVLCRSYVELGLDVVHGLGYHAARKTHLPLDSGVYLARPGYVFESLGCDWGSLITCAP